MTGRPGPRRGVYERPFWDHVQQGQLHLQRCSACGHFSYPPGPACPECLSDSWTWEALSGRGSLLSWATFHRQYFESMRPPYTVVAAETEEGPILITDVVAQAGELRIGMPMRLIYRPWELEDGESLLLYHWTHEPAPE